MKNLTQERPQCARCQIALPDIHWILRLSEPAKNRLSRLCCDCKNELEPKLDLWVEIHKGSVTWTRARLGR